MFWSIHWYVSNVLILVRVLMKKSKPHFTLYQHSHWLFAKIKSFTCIPGLTDVPFSCRPKFIDIRMFSNEQYRPSNSDMFLLVLNSVSRSFRNEFKAQKNAASSTIAHTYRTNHESNSENLTRSTQETSEDIRVSPARRVGSTFFFSFQIKLSIHLHVDNIITEFSPIRNTENTWRSSYRSYLHENNE